MGTGDYIREEVRDEIKHLRWRLQETEKERDRLREERDRYRKLLERVTEEWDYRGKHKYRDGAPAIIFDIRAELEGKR